MFSPFQASGFYCAPVTKGVIGGVILSSAALHFPLHPYSSVLQYTQHPGYGSICQFLGRRLVVLEPKDLVCFAVLFYHFRIFERRYGSHRFANRLFATFLISVLLEMGGLTFCQRWSIAVHHLPCGPFGPLFAMFVPYFCTIPRVAVTQFLGIPITGKSITYIIGLQLASSSLESMALAASGILAGVLYQQNVAYVQQLLWIPAWLATVAKQLFGWALSSSAPQEGLMGASLEIQRSERMEQRERLAWAQQTQRGNGFGFNLFNNYNHPTMNGQPSPVSEDQIRQMTDMGFERTRVEQALRSSNNDTITATNLLLRQT